MRLTRRYFAAAASLSSGALLALAACSDSDPVSSGPDASTQQESAPADTSPPVTRDAGPTDAAPTPVDAADAARSDGGVDAGPLVVEDLRSAVYIRVAADYAFATFSEDDNVLTWPSHPECVAIARSQSKPYSTASTVSIGGQIVGKDGGAAATIELSESNDYSFSDGNPIYPGTDQFTVDVAHGPSTSAFPALPLQTLPPSRAGMVDMTKPTLDAGELTRIAELHAQVGERSTFDADVAAARVAAYAGVAHVAFDGAQCRSDIALGR